MIQPTTYALKHVFVLNEHTQTYQHTQPFLPANISQPLGGKIDGIKLLLSRFFIRIYRRRCTQSFPAALAPINHAFFLPHIHTRLCSVTHTGATHNTTLKSTHTQTLGYGCNKMDDLLGVCCLNHTYIHTQPLGWSNTCTFWLCNGKCQSLSMADPGNALIPSLPPIALIIGKCHLISREHVARLISGKKRGMTVRHGEVKRGSICPRAATTGLSVVLALGMQQGFWPWPRPRSASRDLCTERQRSLQSKPAVPRGCRGAPTATGVDHIQYLEWLFAQLGENGWCPPGDISRSSKEFPFSSIKM